jgi:hypothetical protein
MTRNIPEQANTTASGLAWNIQSADCPDMGASLSSATSSAGDLDQVAARHWV